MDEEEYYKELAYLQAEKDIQDWQEWEEFNRKPAKVELLTKIEHAKPDTEEVHRDS